MRVSHEATAPVDRRREIIPAGGPLILSLLLLAACAPADPGSPVAGIPASGRFHGGMVFGIFSRDEPTFILDNLEQVRGLGANAISIPIPWAVRDVRSTEIRRREDMTPGDETLRFAIREAHRLGMSVLLMPLLVVDEAGEGEWRGTMSPPDWEEWFSGYSALVIRYARIAQEEEAAILSVGSELCSTEGRIDEWRALIARVREIYSGALTYSANWDHRGDISFLDRLDYLGMNAYFELTENPDAGVEELILAWAPILEEVRAWRESTGKPLLVTEAGYPSRRGSARDPWDYTAEGEPDPEGQARAYEALLRAWAGFPRLAGVYFYLWWGEGGPGDTGYTPRGKPAEAVLREWLPEGGEGDTSR